MKSLIESKYVQLVTQLKKEIVSGHFKAQEAYAKEKVLCYWRMSKVINTFLSESNRADYGQRFFKNLAEDLSVSEKLLYQISKFYMAYPKFSFDKFLTWSHYRLLASVNDPKIRESLEKRAIGENWSIRMLELFLDEARTKTLPSQKKSVEKRLRVFRGKLYVYKVKKASFLKDKNLADLGFNVFREISYQGSSKVIETIKEGDVFKVRASKTHPKLLYFYKAVVERVIDGDTIWVHIDCGFGIWQRQKLRLRGIDAGDLPSASGVKAKRFVESRLNNLSFIVVKTHYRDKYDRYLVDLFYLEKEEDPSVVLEKGSFLNQELLDNGLARRV